MSDYNTKLEIEDWKSNGENGIDINRLYYLKFDSDVEDINERLNETRFMSGFSYTKIDKTFQELVNDLSILNAYIVKVLDEIDEKIDEPYYQELNRGVLEDLERIKLEDFTIPNNLGITEEKYVTTSDPTAQYGVTTTTVRTEKKELTLEDMLNNYEMDGSQGFKTFTDMYRDQFQSMQQATDEMKDLDFNDYVNAVIHQADYQHTVDAGWLNTLSDILDVVGITSIIGSFTGTNVFTGEVLTDSEQSAAIFNAVINVGLLVLTVATAGVGSVAAVGIKAAASMAAKQVAKSLIIDMVAGIGGMAATHVLQSIGAPPWLAVVVGMGTAFVGGFSGQKVLDAITSKHAVNSLLKQGVNGVDDLLASGKNIDDLIRMGIKPKALVDLGINSVDDLTKLGVNTLDDWKRLGFKAKDLKYFGFNSLDEVDDALKQMFKNPGRFIEGMNGEDAARYSAWNIKRESGLSLELENEILDVPKGLRPNPSEYLSPEYISNHLSNFNNGGSFVMTVKQYESFISGNSMIGFPDNTQFITSTNLLNDIELLANGDISVYETMLGFEQGYFQSQGGLVQIDINIDRLTRSIPSGNEMGANDLWLPGGFTSGGIVEVIVPQIPNTPEYVNIIFK
ncbi:hypothetical protein HCA54_02505 [Listeria welshimeri]|nr:hypothetical protein [Listeria welshimeri]